MTRRVYCAAMLSAFYFLAYDPEKAGTAIGVTIIALTIDWVLEKRS